MNGALGTAAVSYINYSRPSIDSSHVIYSVNHFSVGGDS